MSYGFENFIILHLMAQCIGFKKYSYLSGLLPLIQDTKFNKSKSPTKLFEYMAMAKATVSSDIGESSYVIKDGDNGFLAKNKVGQKTL